MSLITCKDCGQQISSKASSCPGCGAPVPSAKSSIKRVFRYAVYAMFALILFVVLKASYMTTAAIEATK